MKPNFTLTKDTRALFLHRLNKLLSISGAMKMQSEYTGAKARRSLVRHMKSPLINVVVKTNPHYLDKDTIDIYPYPGPGSWKSSTGINIKVNDDCVMTFYYGQKFKFTPNSIIECNIIPDYHTRQFGGSKGVLSVYHDVEHAKIENAQVNAYAAIYWEDYENHEGLLYSEF